MSLADDDIKTEYMDVENRRTIPVDETVLFDSSFESPGMPASCMQTARVQYLLLRKRTGERIVVDVPSTIGRGFAAETKIKGNRAISRAHAQVQMANGRLVIIDLDSVNGTRVRGNRIPPRVPVAIGVGDEICFASEAFKLLMER